MASHDMENMDTEDSCTPLEPKEEYLAVLAPITKELDPNDIYYSMKKAKRGLVIIFNQEVFDEINGRKLAPRTGTSEDVLRLSETFERLGFKIEEQKDKTYKEITQYISEVSKMDELNNYDCLVVFVLTHGSEGEVICAYDQQYYVKELVEPFTGENCTQLKNKPKLFFIQACKGDGIPFMTDSVLVQGTSKTSVINGIHEISDVLVAYTTIEGFGALRDPITGSPYMKCLCEELDHRGTEEDLLNILIRVHQRLSTVLYYSLKTNQGKIIQNIKVQASFLCYLNRLVRFDARLVLPQTK